MKRREFLKQSVAGATAVSILGRELLYAAEAGTPARVALVKTEDRARGVAEALRLVPFASPKGKKVLIKPNFNSSDPAPGSTDNATLRQLVLEMKARGASHVTVGERSGPPPTRSVIEAKGIPALGQELGFDIVNFEDLPEEGRSIQPAGQPLAERVRRRAPGRGGDTSPGRAASRPTASVASSACRSSWPGTTTSG
jgi:hypothetical protein